MVSLAGSSSLVPVLLPQLTGELGIIWWFWFLLWGQQRGASVLVPGLPGTEHLHSRSQNQRVLQVFVGLDQQTRSSSSTCTERKKSFHCRLLRKSCWLPAAHLSLQELSAVL